MKSIMISRSIRSLFLFALLLLPAQGYAATILNGGAAMSAGLSGDLGFSPGVPTAQPGVDLYSDVQGSLNPFTQIVFTYVVTLPDESIIPAQWPTSVSGFSGTTSMTPWTNYFDPIFGSYVSNQFTADFTLTNASASIASFMANIQGPDYADIDVPDMETYGVSTTYMTAAVSNVPLPAALPLFGLGLAGLAAARRARGKKEVA